VLLEVRLKRSNCRSKETAMEGNITSSRVTATYEGGESIDGSNFV